MKNTFFSISFISQLIVYAIANAILFLVLPNETFSLTSYWIAWAFTFPLCIITTLLVTIYCSHTNNSTIVKLPLLFTIQYSSMLIYFIAGIILMSLGIDSIAPVLVTELAITAIYAVLFLYAWATTSYLTKNIAYTKAKVFFIRSLCVDLDNCIPTVNNPEDAKKISDLSEKIRYSDPISHPSLRESEIKLQDLVFQIVHAASANASSEISKLTYEATVELNARNNKCKLLK